MSANKPHPIERCWWIDALVLGGRYPGTLDPAESREILKALVTAGVRRFVNLQEPDEVGLGGKDFPDYTGVVADHARELGVSVQCQRFPVQDGSVPRIDTTHEVLEAIADSVGRGELVYVHCWGGHGRTGVIAGCWKVSNGLTPQDALASITAARQHDAHLREMGAPEYEHQRNYVLNWVQHARPLGKAGITGRERARGSLLGLAIGDAVGTALEFQPPGSFHPINDMMGGGPFNLKPGQFTDDTSLALCLAESLVERGFCDPVDQNSRYLQYWKKGKFSSTGQCFDIGNQTSAALTEFTKGGKPFCGPTGEQNASNGSLMRLAPVPIAFAAWPAAAIVHAATSSRTTHGARDCVDACRFFAGLVVGAMQGRSKQELMSPLFSPVPGIWQAEPLSPAIEAVARGSFAAKNPPQIKGTGHVVASLEAALWAFNKANDYRETVLLATNLGDDADTTAAIAGQLAGAYYAVSGLPQRWLERLHMRAEIEKLAERLHGMSGLAN